MSFAGNIPQVAPDNMRQFMANTINELLSSLNYVDVPENHSVEVYRTGNGAWHIQVYQGRNHYEYSIRLEALH